VGDFAVTDVFHVQPGLMYIKKEYNYLEFPLLISIKVSALRLNAGPYFDWGCFTQYAFNDIGLSGGIGFDIGRFYIGAFYDHGFISEEKVYYRGLFNSIYPYTERTYNRTIGLNFGINL